MEQRNTGWNWHHFNLTLSPMCLKCKIEVCTLNRCLWSCQKLQTYWCKVLSEIEKILGLELEGDPVSLILGLPSQCLTSKHNKRLYYTLTYAARKNILLQWINIKKNQLLKAGKEWCLFWFHYSNLHVYYIPKQTSSIKVWNPIWTA